MDAASLIEIVTGLAPGIVRVEESGMPAVSVALDGLYDLLRWLRDDHRLRFDLLLTHTAVDWPERDRFELVYVMYSTEHGHHLIATAEISRSNPVAPTASDIWPIAHWQEREVYDMFGIQYDGHPDLRRLFLEDDWSGYPLRKDYQDEHMLERPVWP
ncbi:MAG: NADH-quinone oxidoreductase subunit C [Candidatus Hydrogenedentes bacterium]|nr:NADH-quinone oxidoreductase subunit C [Candidatus Hydrogenedentota bacterium]